MSERVVAAARAYYAATRALDIEAMLVLCAEDIELHAPVASPPQKGREAARHFFQTIKDLFEAIGVTEEFVYATEASAATKWTCNGIARSGSSVSFEGIDILTIDAAGKISKIEGYWDPARMLAAVEG